MSYVGNVFILDSLDRVAQLGHATICRKMLPAYLPGGLTEFWIGYRFRLRPLINTRNLNDKVFYSAGLCSGTVSPFNVGGTNEHLVGIFSATSIVYQALTTAGGKTYTSGGVAVRKQVDGVQTTSTGGTKVAKFPTDVSVRGLHVVRFRRPPATPNSWSTELVFPNTDAALEFDVLSTKFATLMEAPTWAGLLAGLPTGYTSTNLGTIAINEGGDGVLDSVYFSWNLNFSPFYLSEIVCACKL